MDRVKVFIAATIPDEFVQKMERADARIELLYDRSLLPEPRYECDRVGKPMEFTAEMRERWESMFGEAEVMFGFSRPDMDRLPQLAPNLKWVQGTSTGIGKSVIEGYKLAGSGITFSTASGIHSIPIAEFVGLALTFFSKDLPRLLNLKKEKRFERFASDVLQGKTIGIVGLGKNGTRVAEIARAFGMRVIGTKRVTENANPSVLGVDRIYPREDLHAMLAECDYLSICCPLTPWTEKMIGAPELAALPQGAVVINNSFGGLIDEPALIKALQSGHLRGAGLDVFAQEPLPDDSPLWEMDNVLLSPHTASTSKIEDAAMTDLFIDNLRRHLDGRPLRNVLDFDLHY